MTLAGIELRYLINEINQRTPNYYVSNIYSITKESILIKLHHPEKSDLLLMLSTFGLWLSSVKINQIEQNRLVKRLRSDLLRLKITKIQQIGAERIAYLTFSGFDKEFILVGEFFGDGNIILCNKDMKILALLHSIDVRHRTLRVGLQYIPPPEKSLDIFNISKKDFEELKTSNLASANWVGRKLGLPKKYVEEIFRISKIDPKIPGVDLISTDLDRIYLTVKEIVNKVISGQHKPIIVRTEKIVDVYPLELGQPDNPKLVSTFSEGLDIIFTESILDKGKSIQSSGTDKKILEFQNMLDEQTKALTTVKEKSDAITSLARALMSAVSTGIISINDPKSLEIFTKQNSQIIKEKGQTLVTISGEKIKINPQASIPTIASNLFDVAKRKSGAISSIRVLMDKTQKKLNKLQDKKEIEKGAITFSEIRKKNWFERYRWFYTSDNLLAIGGRDASSNTSLIRKHMEKNDKIFHAEIFGSPFFILKNSENPPQASLREVAHATVCFSRAWRETMYGLSAYWVNPEQVKKAAPSGQYLPKGSFTIDGQRNFCKISSMKLAVGLVKQNENYFLCCGPPEPIKKHCICYAIIEPSGSQISALAKKIKLEFLKIMEDETKPISIDDFVRVLPAGESHIVETGLGKNAKET